MKNTSSAIFPLKLGILGFEPHDLFSPEGLRRLHETWLCDLEQEDPNLFLSYQTAIQGKPTEKEHSAFLCNLAPFVSRFVIRLFGAEVEAAARILRQETEAQLIVLQFKDRFVKRRATKPMLSELSKEEEIQLIRFLAEQGCPDPFCEASFAKVVLRLLEEESQLSKLDHAFNDWTALQTQLNQMARWVWEHRDALLKQGWISMQQPSPLDFQNLVSIRRNNPHQPWRIESGKEQGSKRDGFDGVDPGSTSLQRMAQVDYCLYCHEREKDSCSKGLHDKEGKIKKNPLGIDIAGCPLEEKISEMHLLRRQGDAIAALALICLDNPMCPGTGHRICNDCMKSCIFQKQDPVNIPLTETGILSEVLNMPWGVEIYGLLTRWNPLDVQRPYPLPDNGRRVLVVGLGPAGYTLCHYLAREGFGVVGIDGLKLEPPPQPYAGNGQNQTPPVPLKNHETILEKMSERIAYGFGGVSEYGITARWDKNFLTLLYLTLHRNPLIRFFGSIRFGGTLTIEDAWRLGFDHIALSTGAGSPHLLRIPNSVALGTRQASDFLMALHAGTPFQSHALANMQVRLPAWVIGGGLTAIDTATELAAYYVALVEKTLWQWKQLCNSMPSDKQTEPDGNNKHQNNATLLQEIKEKLTLDEWNLWQMYLQHGEAVQQERVLAKSESRDPNFGRLVSQWGGVTIAYRKRLQESPAYRLNHEEVDLALAQGIHFAEQLTPKEIHLDHQGQVASISFWKSDGSDAPLSLVQMPARTICVAVGTQPNTGYEKEHPGTLSIGKNGYFVPHCASFENGPHPHPQLLPDDNGFFASYQSTTGNFISFFGDTHPVYAGSVVKAMASAKKGHRAIVDLFSQNSDTAGREESTFADFCASLHSAWSAQVVQVERLTPTIVELVIKAPAAATKFQPGQFYRLQNFASHAPKADGHPLIMEGLALTGASTNAAEGLLSLVILEMGTSSMLCASLRPGDPVALMGPTGTPTHLPKNQSVCLVGGGLGNAVLFSIGQALKKNGCRVLYFAGYKQPQDLFKPDQIEAAADQIMWCCDVDPIQFPAFRARRPSDSVFVGNVIQAMLAYAQKKQGNELFSLGDIDAFFVIGSDRMMAAVQKARQTILKPYMKPTHSAIASVNSPMMCMMKEICAQCLQRQIDPETGIERFVYSCVNQDQPLDVVDFEHLSSRLHQNSLQEKMSQLWFKHVFRNPLMNQKSDG